ncbi:IS3 family transposase [Corynebacterium urinipleomorphum]
MISAIEAQKPAGARPIIHSDRGGLYRSTKWVEMITDPAHDTNACPQCTPDGRCAQSWRYIPSLSRRGNSGDNARVEGFFGTMKQERLIGRPQTKQMTKAEMIDYINDYIDFYIHKRFKSTLGAGYTTIAQHRQLLSA